MEKAAAECRIWTFGSRNVNCNLFFFNYKKPQIRLDVKDQNTNTKIKKNVTFSTLVIFFFLINCHAVCFMHWLLQPDLFKKGGKAGKDVKSVLSTVNRLVFFPFFQLFHIFFLAVTEMTFQVIPKDTLILSIFFSYAILFACFGYIRLEQFSL